MVYKRASCNASHKEIEPNFFSVIQYVVPPIMLFSQLLYFELGPKKLELSYFVLFSPVTLFSYPSYATPYVLEEKIV